MVISKRFSTVCTEMFLIVLSIHLMVSGYAQLKPNRFGVIVINNLKDYRRSVFDNSSKKMINITNRYPSIILDLRYATANNFMHKILYPPVAKAYLRKAAADALGKVQSTLNAGGLGLKIFDAYRPYAVTVQMWEPIKNEDYVANPAKGSGHNRGIAVDLTLIDLKTSEEINMGTGFDNFSDSAHHTFTQLPDSILEKRKLLRHVMEANGFKAFETEWWHYSLPEPENFDLLDLSFKALRTLDD
ncbi:MAG: M15 family metallopeptidase [Ginsengibacter sp.]